MKALLVRVGADQSDGGGYWNGPMDSRSGEIVYVPIPDDGPFHPGLAKPYSALAAHLGDKWPSSPCEVTLLATYNLAIQAFFAPASGESVAASTTLAFGSRTVTDKCFKNGCDSQSSRD
jgi:hypothetical protein